MKNKVFFILIFVLPFYIMAFPNYYTLEDFYSQPTIKKQMDEYYKNLNALDNTLDYSYKVKENTMIYIYKFTGQQKDVKACRERIISTLRNSVIDLAITAIENEAGIKDARVQYVYYNKDGSEIYNQIWMK